MLGSNLGLKMRESRLVGWMVGRYPGRVSGSVDATGNETSFGSLCLRKASKIGFSSLQSQIWGLFNVETVSPQNVILDVVQPFCDQIPNIF